MGAISKFLLIVTGWTNYVFETPEVKAKAKARALVCAKCPHSEWSKFWQVLPDEGIKEAEGMKCGLCTCPLSTKLRTPEETCPDTPSRWGAYSLSAQTQKERACKHVPEP